MAQRIAASMSLLAFTVCLIAGGLQTGNSFGTTVQRALLAMVVTLVIGLVVGGMAQRMFDEHLKAEKAKPKNLENNADSSDR